MDKGAGWALVHGVAKSQIRLSLCVHMCVRAHTHTHTHTWGCKRKNELTLEKHVSCTE